MHIESFLLFALIAGLGAVFVSGRVKPVGGRSSLEQLPAKGLPLLGDKFESELRQYLENGKKIEALKMLREATGIDLKQAVNVLDLLEQGQSLRDIASAEEKLLDSCSNALLDTDAMAKIQSLLKAGKKIEAIKLYRLCTGKGLKDAKDEVERLEKELR